MHWGWKGTLVALALASSGMALADTRTLTGTIRDFKMRGTDGGHPDFEWQITGLNTGMVASTLGANKRPTYIGTNNYGGVTSAETFDQWYQDVPNVNLSTSHAITLSDVGHPGMFRYSSHDLPSGAFFPIDDQLFGNQGASHNFAFTYGINGSFVYQAGQHFAFSGDDDVWVFIDNRLAVDLGGVHSETGGAVNLDSLGLTAGQTYDFDFYFAERHTSDSNFTMELNFNVVPEPASMVALIGGVSALLMRRRKR